MSAFHLIPEAVVILRANGVYKQAEVYHFNEMVFAKYGSGYVKLGIHGTSKPKIYLESADLPFKPISGKFGWWRVPVAWIHANANVTT